MLGLLFLGAGYAAAFSFVGLAFFLVGLTLLAAALVLFLHHRLKPRPVAYLIAVLIVMGFYSLLLQQTIGTLLR